MHDNGDVVRVFYGRKSKRAYSRVVDSVDVSGRVVSAVLNNVKTCEYIIGKNFVCRVCWYSHSERCTNDS